MKRFVLAVVLCCCSNLVGCHWEVNINDDVNNCLLIGGFWEYGKCKPPQEYIDDCSQNEACYGCKEDLAYYYDKGILNISQCDKACVLTESNKFYTGKCGDCDYMDASQNRCKDDETNTYLECQIDGSFKEIKCSNECNKLTNQCNPECELGDRECDLENPSLALVCNAEGVWEKYKCSEGCTEGKCQECTEGIGAKGEKYCVKDEIFICKNGVPSSYETCDQGTICEQIEENGAQCISRCSEDEEEYTRCSSDQKDIEICRAGTWKKYKACSESSDKTYCNTYGVELKCESCKNGAQRCEKYKYGEQVYVEQVQECINGEWKFIQNCNGDALVCNATGDKAACECKDGDKRCIGEHYLQECKSGKWTLSQDCSQSNQICSAQLENFPQCVEHPCMKAGGQPGSEFESDESQACYCPFDQTETTVSINRCTSYCDSSNVNCLPHNCEKDFVYCFNTNEPNNPDVYICKSDPSNSNQNHYLKIDPIQSYEDWMNSLYNSKKTLVTFCALNLAVLKYLIEKKENITFYFYKPSNETSKPKKLKLTYNKYIDTYTLFARTKNNTMITASYSADLLNKYLENTYHLCRDSQYQGLDDKYYDGVDNTSASLQDNIYDCKNSKDDNDKYLYPQCETSESVMGRGLIYELRSSQFKFDEGYELPKFKTICVYRGSAMFEAVD